MSTRAGSQGFTLRALLADWADQAHLPDQRVGGLNLDSRKVRPGDLFLALAGHRSHGMAYAEDASARGAGAIAYDPANGGAVLSRQSGVDIPCIAIRALDQCIGLIADKFFGHPSASFDVIGVTGTNGKTSCSHFLAQAFSDDVPCAVIGTLGSGLPAALTRNLNTTPNALEIHAALARFRDMPVQAVAMEVSSHGQVQGRVNGVHFRGALYTNITRDHLDYHGSMEAYVEAKLGLLQSPGMDFAVVNLDDPHAARIMAAAPSALRTIGFSCDPAASAAPRRTVVAGDIEHRPGGLRFSVQDGGGTATVAVPLFGDFNVENLLGVLAVLLAMGYRLEDAAARLKRVRAVPGRMERFIARPAGPCVVVDYAHTPDALAKVLQSLRRHCQGTLWAVFGCGGERDRGKRPLMGRIAEERADRVIVTDDNPRSEDGDDIVQDILAGCRRAAVPVIRDRRAAIEAAIGGADAADIVLVAGKGHESAQEIRGVKYPFSDRDVVVSVLESRPQCGSVSCA